MVIEIIVTPKLMPLSDNHDMIFALFGKAFKASTTTDAINKL